MNIRYLILSTPKEENLHIFKKDDTELTIQQIKIKKELHSMNAEWELMSGMGEFNNNILWLLRIAEGIQRFSEFLVDNELSWEVLRMQNIKKQLLTELIDEKQVPVLDGEGKKQYETVSERKDNASDSIIQRHLIKRKDKNNKDIGWTPGEVVPLARHDNANERENPPTLTIG